MLRKVYARKKGIKTKKGSYIISLTARNEILWHIPNRTVLKKLAMSHGQHDRLSNHFPTIFSQDSTVQPAEPWQHRSWCTQLPARGIVLVLPHQQKPHSGSAHTSASSSGQQPAKLKAARLRLMAGQALSPYAAHVAVCCLVPNKMWRLWKLSLSSAHQKHTWATQTEKYLNFHFPQLSQTLFLLVPLQAFIAWQKKEHQDL